MFSNELLSQALRCTDSVPQSGLDESSFGLSSNDQLVGFSPPPTDDAQRVWKPKPHRFRLARRHRNPSAFMQLAPSEGLRTPALPRQHITTLLFTPSQDISSSRDKSPLLASRSPLRTRTPFDPPGRVFKCSPLSAQSKSHLQLARRREGSMSPNSDIEVSLFRGKLARYLSKANVDTVAKPFLQAVTPLQLKKKPRFRSPSGVFPLRRHSKETSLSLLKRGKPVESELESFRLGPW